MVSLRWRCRQHDLTVGPRPLVMGIVNVTPDSFSDGGRFFDPATAVEHGLRLVAEGADILDVGGESTRPGSDPVSADEELRRVLPVVEELARQTAVPISVDTSKAAVARRCLEAGVAIVNDVTGLRGDPEMPGVVKATGAGAVVMHMQGTPATMQADPRYGDVVLEIGKFFRDRFAALTDFGIDPEALALDPGVGFGKTQAHNLQLLANLTEYRQFERPIVLGVSRKGMIGLITGRPRSERAAGSMALACLAAAANPALVWRVHDVALHRDAALLVNALEHHRNPIPY